jgi:hypothetical protein
MRAAWPLQGHILTLPRSDASTLPVTVRRAPRPPKGSAAEAVAKTLAAGAAATLMGGGNKMRPRPGRKDRLHRTLPWPDNNTHEN